MVALDLAGDLNVDPRLIAQQGAGHSQEVIVLPAAGGRVLPPPQEYAETIRFPAVEPTGILGNWLEGRVTVVWNVHIPTAGRYGMEMITSAVRHSHPWQGGHRMRLETEQDSVEAVLEMDEMDTRPETRYYAQALSRCGTLRFSTSGMHRVTLKPLDIQPNGGVGLALVAVRLRRANY